MSAKEYDVTLGLIIQATQKLADFSANYNLDDFLQDQKTQSAVIMQLIVVGELAKKLPEDIRNGIDLPWKLMSGFRNLAVHEYFELDLKQVWDTATRDIPVVQSKLKNYLQTKI